MSIVSCQWCAKFELELEAAGVKEFNEHELVTLGNGMGRKNGVCWPNKII